MLKILVLDDVAFNCRFTKMILERAGHVVLMASSGPEALELLQEHNDIDVVFSDLGMPEMDGIDTLKNAKRLKRYTDEGLVALPPFILITEEINGKVLSDAMKVGFAEILKKPAQADKLLNITNKIEDGSYAGASDVYLAVVYSDISSKIDELNSFLTKRDFEVQSAEAVHEAMALLTGFRKVSLFLALVDNYALFTNLLRAFKTFVETKKIPLPPIVVYLKADLMQQAQADTELSEGVQYFSQPINYVGLDGVIEAYGLKRDLGSDMELGDNAVLIIDEVAFSRATIEKGLKRMGLEVIATSSVVDALQAYQHYPQIKLVCTKVAVKDVSVSQLYAACEKIERYTDEGVVPMAEFLLLADQKDKIETRNFVKLGIEHILWRPLPTDKILSEIKDLLQGKPKEVASNEDPLSSLAN